MGVSIIFYQYAHLNYAIQWYLPPNSIVVFGYSLCSFVLPFTIYYISSFLLYWLYCNSDLLIISLLIWFFLAASLTTCLGYLNGSLFPILVTGESPYPLLVVRTFLSFIFELLSSNVVVNLFLFMVLLYHSLFICQYIFCNIFKLSIFLSVLFYYTIYSFILVLFSEYLPLKTE